MKLRPVSLAVLTLLAAISAAKADEIRRPYVVQLSDKPVASYDGTISGLNATRPATGSRLQLDTSEVQQYSAYLSQKRAAAMALVANAQINHEYNVVLNGFSAMLTDDEVRALQNSGQIASIQADVPQHMETNYTPTFLGLDQPGGLWSKLGGIAGAGENVIVGIIDGGVWPENPAYADRVDADGNATHDASGTLVYGPAPAGWKGTCQTGEGFTTAHCNNKLIGANYFDATFRADKSHTTHWSEFKSSPRDSLGPKSGEGSHGTHTSSTAAGNANVKGNIAGVPIGSLSGMAPRARVSTYKVCWSYDSPVTATEPYGAKNTCYQSDSVAAIEKAIADGVNVLNFSISGGTSVTDVVEQAFLHATNAGVFVSASAGNSGPANEVAHISPWLATVAASTHNRATQATLGLANGNSYKGSSLNPTAVVQSDIIMSSAAGINGADPLAVRQCHSVNDPNHVAVLDPAKVAGKIVVCERGSTDRVNKSLAVKQAGGVGMVLINVTGGATDLYSDIHAVPSVHMDAATGVTISTYAAGAGAQASLSKYANNVGTKPAPVVTDFSSRGPNRFDPDTLKPDVTAPGKDILAGATPGLSVDERQQVVDGTLVPPAAWVSMQGTSMSSPHVAGLGALLKNLHPTWSPAAIKSALMTSTTPALDDGLTGAQSGLLPWAQGAGHVAPNKAADPGLVYDLGALDYKKYLCGRGVAAECGSGSLQPYNLNLPSISVSNVVAPTAVTRTVTNVGDSTATYTVSTSISGFTANVSPTSLTLAPGESKSYTVTVARTTAADNTWKFGQVVWTDGVHTVRSPLQLKGGKPVVAPALVSADRTGGTRAVNVVTGFAGNFVTAKGGMKEVTQTASNVSKVNTSSVSTTAKVATACNTGIAGTRVFPITLPAGTVAARFELFDRDTDGGGGHDLDLALLYGSTLVGYSGGESANETINLASPPAGNYKVCVIGYAPANGVSSNFSMSSAIVNKTDIGGNLKVAAPTKAISGATLPVVISWSGLPTGKRYLGGVQYAGADGATVAATTMLSIETNSPVPVPESVAKVMKDDGQ